MNGKVNHMVSENVGASDIVVESKSKIRQRTAYLFMVGIESVEGFCQVFPWQRLKVNIGVVNDIGEIIQMPGTVKAVAVENDERCKNSDKSKKIPVCFADTLFQRRVKTVIILYHLNLFLKFLSR